MRCIAIILFVATAFTALADEKKYGSFILNTEIPDTLFFLDEIRANDSLKLRKALRNHDIQNIVLASPGGSVREGLLMAGIIYDKKLRTYIPRGGKCESACAFLFFAGNERLADGDLGVHQAYSANFKEKKSVGQTQYRAQYTVSEIIGFLNEFGTPAFVYERMFQDIDMYFFDPLELMELNSETFGLESSQKIAATKFMLARLKEQKEKKPELTRKEMIALIQTRLKEAGCNPGPADGIWGRRTQSAAVTFAKKAGLPSQKQNLISEEFILKLSEAPANYCPQPVIKKKPKGKLAGKWITAANCNHLGIGNISGEAKITLSTVGNAATFYEVNYSNSMGQKAVGTLIHYTDRNNIAIRLDFGRNGMVSARLTHSKGIYSGTDSNGCPFIARKQ